MVIKTNIINQQIESDLPLFVFESEKEYSNQIEKAAIKIVNNGIVDKPLILISGPSGSGKTTTAIKLSDAIKKLGENVCFISMDKYFKNYTPEEQELKRLNKIDLESPERVDVGFLIEEIQKLINGETIDVPKYDFTTNSRHLTGKKIARNGGFVIVEGIHALNPSVLGSLDEYSNKMYVSVRTRVMDNNGDKLHPCKIRLMRRIIRDKLYRGRQMEETIKMFSYVQRGENSYIMPYKSRADIDIDTFIPYEPAIYKKYLYDELVELSAKYADVRDVVNALDEIAPISHEVIASDSLIREFIGGSSLSY